MIPGLLALLLGGCMDAVLEAPYVLATGLNAPTSLAPTGRNTLFVGGADGLWEVDGEGKRTAIATGAITAITAHPRELYLLGEGVIRYGPLPQGGQPFQEKGRYLAPGVRDAQAWCDETVLLAGPDEITAWNPTTGESSVFAMGLKDLRAIGLGGGEGCDYALAVTDTAVLAVKPSGTEVLAHDLVHARAAALDHAGRLWAVAGDPASLMLVEAGVTRVFARYLGDPRDIVAGLGGLLPPSNLYLADGEGTVDYVHTP